MGNTSYVSLSMATALERSLDATAHNLSNASTAGYKAFRPIFETVSEAAEGPSGHEVSYVQDAGNYLDAAQGAVMPTGNPLDLAITGKGWFAFEAEGGRVAFGRNGRLVVDVDGRLSTTTGRALLDTGGAPIILPANIGQDISVARDGTITGSDGTRLGQVGMYDVDFETLMHPIGNGLYISPLGIDGAAASQDSQVAQGFVETSNVEPVIEMTRMIDIQRAYENSLKLLTEENALTRQTIQRIGQFG
jgi:flagellar basal-body rod protein FlgF